jgi:hypothetical protein
MYNPVKSYNLAVSAIPTARGDCSCDLYGPQGVNRKITYPIYFTIMIVLKFTQLITKKKNES